jgi:hypothetical protein
MSMKTLVGALGGALLLWATSCSTDPEAFCQSWVVSTCQSLSKCCKGGPKFDLEDCRIQMSRTCQQATQVNLVMSGDAKFDSDAATTCLAPFATCAGAPTPNAPLPVLEQQACNNMVTGFAPNGASCTTTSDCAKEGDAPVCYTGIQQGQLGGICATLVIDPSRCSYSFASGELHVCADGSFCDQGAFMPKPGAPPSSVDFEFSASCKGDLAAGAACIKNGLSAPCRAGLFCDVMVTGNCTPLGGSGAPCLGPNECAAGLQCLPSPGGMATCGTAQGNASFCFGPSMCGDGVCTPPETFNTCPQDCVPGPTCGDGVCEPPETHFTCPQDCV